MMEEKRAPRNTSLEARQDPLLALVVAMPGGIEAQEAQGQQELVNSNTLPTDFNREEDGKELLEFAGVVFGEPVPDDDLFQFVTLPNGWKIQPTDHNMWSELLDSTGRKRAMIFYKAAFYDRKAFISVERKFSDTP